MIVITSKQLVFSTDPHRQFWENKKQSVRHYLKIGKTSKNRNVETNETDAIEYDQSKNAI